MEILGQGSCTPKADKSPPFLVLTGGGVALDGVRLRHVFLRDLYVQYDGGPTQLEDLTFINCKFGGLINPQSMEFIKVVLSATKVTFPAPTRF
jgi:hypothetical protein